MRTETAYLRRMTRAHAAGEMDTADYRRRRRAAIEACSSLAPDQDVTVPRSSWAGPAAGADTDTGSTMVSFGVANLQHRRMTGDTRRRLLMMSVAGLVMLLVAWLW